MIYRVTILLFAVCLAGIAQSAGAQSQQLSRISVTERADGGGLVLRYHLSGQPESYTVQRPRTNLIQMNLYGVQAAANVELPLPGSSQVERVELFEADGGISADIHLAEGALFSTETYPDVNGRDLLLSLAYVAEAVAEQLVDPESEISRVEEDESEPVQAEESLIDTTAGQEVQRPRAADSQKITFGLQIGLSTATAHSRHFSKGFRNGMALGAVVNIPLPYVLPYNMRTSIESGLLYTQKGMTGNLAEYLNASSVEFDYMEIPVLGKVGLPVTSSIEVYGLIGPSVGFVVSSERIRESDGRRVDLDERTRSADVAFNLGGGLQTEFGNAILYGQVKGSLSLPDAFKSNEQAEPEDAFKHRYVALEIGIRF